MDGHDHDHDLHDRRRHRRGCFRCSVAPCLLILTLLSALPISFLISLERIKHSTTSYEYRSLGWLRETAKWDAPRRRFLVSRFEGGVSQIPDVDGADLAELPVVGAGETAGNASLGLLIDHQRNRVLVAVADALGNRYGGLVAYDLSSWETLFITHLAGPGDEKSLADDVAVDGEGNAYVTDAKSSKLWKVGLKGELIKVIKHPLFTERKEWYNNLLGLNGIVYHPNGYLLVIHTSTGSLYKVEVRGDEELVTKVKVDGSLIFGDGLELLSPTQLVVAGTPAARLVESFDGWVTARVAGKYRGLQHRVVASATVKDGKVCLSHIFGGLPPRKHVITEAVFTRV